MYAEADVTAKELMGKEERNDGTFRYNGPPSEARASATITIAAA